MTIFCSMDSITASLWRELMLAALPIREVTPEEFATMTKDLLDDEPNPLTRGL
jgi:hypothetical protein